MSSSDELLTIERVAALQRVGMFAAVPGHTLVAVARVIEEVRFAVGDVVMERGAIEDWLYVVVEGALRVHVGDRVLVHRGPGDVVGELAVLALSARSATVTALEPCLLLRLRRKPFEELLEERPGIARAVIAELVRRLQDLADQDAKRAQA